MKMDLKKLIVRKNNNLKSPYEYEALYPNGLVVFGVKVNQFMGGGKTRAEARKEAIMLAKCFTCNKRCDGHLFCSDKCRRQYANR